MDVSVIIPHYNAGNYLPEAINSLRPFLKSSSILCEVIIADDGSTDAHSIAVLKQLEQEGLFKVIRQSNKGPAAARNNAISNSTGKYLLFLDSDNKIRPALIEKGVEVLSSGKADIFYGKAHFFGEKTKPLFSQGELN
ncbi:MAG: glycosyltransferase family 2 protein, partial [Sphingobacteriaceae bacterium]